VAQIMKPAVAYCPLAAGMAKSFLDLLQEVAPIGEDPVMVQRSDYADFLQYIISLIAKKNNLGF
jgi:hypothetical protein